MAYVIWRVVMKKYSRIRLGLSGSQVTPSNPNSITYDEESWKPMPEESGLKEKSQEASSTSTSSSKGTKVKKVKKYFKKCKNVLGSSKSSNSFDCDTVSQISDQSTSYSVSHVDPRLKHLLQEGEIKEVKEEFVLAETFKSKNKVSLEFANVVQVNGPIVVDNDVCINTNAAKDNKKDKELNFKNIPFNNSASVENFQSAFSSLSQETLISDDCEYFSLESKNFSFNETEIKHKLNVLESFSEDMTNGNSNNSVTNSAYNSDIKITKNKSSSNFKENENMDENCIVDSKEQISFSNSIEKNAQLFQKGRILNNVENTTNNKFSFCPNDTFKSIASPLLKKKQEKVDGDRIVKENEKQISRLTTKTMENGQKLAISRMVDVNSLKI